MKKLNILTTILALILSTINASYAKDFAIDYYAGISFAKTEISQESLGKDKYDTEIDSGTNNNDVGDIDFLIGARFTLFNKFTLSPELLFLDNKINSSYRENQSYNDGGSTAYINNTNLNHSAKLGGLAHLKLGYLINNKTNFYGSIGLLKANNKLNHSYFGSCSSSGSLCNGGSSSSVSVSNQFQLKKDSHVVYGFGVETRIANNFLLDLSYLISEKENYLQNISYVNELGNNVSYNVGGDYQYERMAINLKYLF